MVASMGCPMWLGVPELRLTPGSQWFQGCRAGLPFTPPPKKQKSYQFLQRARVESRDLSRVKAAS